MQTELFQISEIAKERREGRIKNLVYLLSEEGLAECFAMLKRGKASGIDGIDIGDYEKDLPYNLKDLVEKMKRQAYKPQPVRRVYIPKSNGRSRPLGIPAIEDKIVQLGISRILGAIYENDFFDFSYGFRPNKDSHGALEELNKIITSKPINHIIDADIRGFFDTINHDWMIKFLEHRIKDKSLIRLIARFLRTGYMERGCLYKSEQGTPQGGVISPILANIYLHYVLDLWMVRIIKKRFRGAVEIVRYADDFIICVQYADEALELLRLLNERMKKFGLELSSDKTRIIEFGRYAAGNARKKEKKPETFDFLGFTHYCDKSRKGRFKVGRKTERKRYFARLKEMNCWLKSVRNRLSVKDWWLILKSKLRGHFQYYGVSENYKSIRLFYRNTIRLVYKWLNRRSQRKSFNWQCFVEYLRIYEIPKPKIFHNFYALKCINVNSNEEPVAGKSHGGFCEGHRFPHTLKYV
jgi:group II intron reverse transcriptase/maturase